MNNTRKIKTFIGATTVAAIASAGYATFVSHNTHVCLAAGGSGAGCSDFEVESEAARDQRQHVSEPALLADGSGEPECCRSGRDRMRFDRGAVLAAKNAKLNPQQLAFNLSMMMFASSVACLIFHAEWLHATQASLQHARTGARDRHPVPGTDSSSGRHRRDQRRRKQQVPFGGIWLNFHSLTTLSAPESTSMVSAMSSHLGWGLALAVFSGDVRHPSLVSALLQPARGSFAVRASWSERPERERRNNSNNGDRVACVMRMPPSFGLNFRIACEFKVQRR